MPAIVELPPIIQGGTTVLYGRLTDIDNVPLLQEQISSITVKSYDMGERSNAVATDTPSVASVVFDELQPWPTDIPGFSPPDAIGYNVRYETLPTFCPQGDRRYQIEMKAILLADGKPRSQIWRQPTADLFQE